jgi:hypothetical protein
MEFDLNSFLIGLGSSLAASVIIGIISIVQMIIQHEHNKEINESEHSHEKRMLVNEKIIDRTESIFSEIKQVLFMYTYGAIRLYEELEYFKNKLQNSKKIELYDFDDFCKIASTIDSDPKCNYNDQTELMIKTSVIHTINSEEIILFMNELREIYNKIDKIKRIGETIKGIDSDDKIEKIKDVLIGHIETLKNPIDLYIEMIKKLNKIQIDYIEKETM